MRDREILALANTLGLYDRKLEFVEITPDELIAFAHEIADRAVDETVGKIKHALDKL
jgi:hypothetical protein